MASKIASRETRSRSRAKFSAPAVDKGLDIFELSHRYPPIKRMAATALPIMPRMAYALEQSCHLVVYRDGAGMAIAQVDSSSAVTAGGIS